MKKQQDIRSVLLLICKFLDGAIATGQPLIGQMLCNAVHQSFPGHDSFTSRTVIQTCHPILASWIQPAQTNRSVGDFGLVTKNIDHGFSRVLFDVLDRIPSRGTNSWMVHVFEQKMTVLLEE